MERTLTILKPDAVAAGKSGSDPGPPREGGLSIPAFRRARLSPEQAQAFYAVHRERPFYDALVRFMTEGPVVVAALEREDAVAHLRRTMGATDSRKAEPGTVRNLFGTDIERNAIHGSDSAENAANEIAFFFAGAS